MTQTLSFIYVPRKFSYLPKILCKLCVCYKELQREHWGYFLSINITGIAHALTRARVTLEGFRALSFYVNSLTK